MDYEKLSIIAERVIAGKTTITRLDNEEEQGRIAGGRRNVEATLAIGTANELHKDKQNGTNIAINEQSAQQKSILKRYAELAEQNGNKIWYSHYDKKMRAETEQKLHETIVRYMKEKFDAVPAYSSNTYANSNYIIRDLHLENIISERNVLTFPNEHLYIIDANVSLNTDIKNNGVRNYCPLRSA